MKRWIYWALTLLLAAILAVSGVHIATTLLDYRSSAQSYRSAAETAGLPQSQPAPPADQSAPDSSEQPSFQQTLAAIDLAALQQVNPEVIGWIAIPDTELSYPLLQTSNNSYYLNHLWNKQRNSGGSIYLECQNAQDFSDFNTIIYGHRMRDDSMFGTLRHYADADFFQAHPSVYLADGNGVRQYDIFAAYEVGVREIVYRLDADQTKEEFIQFCLSHSAIQTGVEPTPEDHVLTLSTCTERGHATRWVVQAVLRDQPDPGPAIGSTWS
ncbi:MAG: class B sortase [Lawsonibacter sp.]|nr:class B sortase [Lawsonibacter sp.]